MANELQETPNGCRIDNGRCFSNLELDEKTGVVHATFRDGSEYDYFGLSNDEARLWLSQLDPGCFFNKMIWPGQYVRTRAPD